MTTDETRTQVTEWNTEQVAYWKGKYRDAEATIERAKACHPRDGSNPLGPWCPTCMTPWPCPTIRALDGPDSHETQEG